MHHTTPSASQVTSRVAKCSATYGEYVQSRSRVGSPWCWPSASQSQSVSRGTASCAAYLRNARRSWRSRCPSPPSRASLFSRPLPSTARQPRNAYVLRKTPSSSFHESAKRSSCSSVQLSATCSPAIRSLADRDRRPERQRVREPDDVLVPQADAAVARAAADAVRL